MTSMIGPTCTPTIMASHREKLQSAAEAFCEAFSQNKDLDTILGHFSSQDEICAIEYGLPKLAPFLGRPFVGKDKVRGYFETIGALLSYSEIRFSEYVVDAESLKVSVKGNGRFMWKSTGVEWDEVFTYTLDFDDAFKVLRYQIWADSGAAYPARTGQTCDSSTI